MSTNFVPTQEEKALVDQIFTQGDPHKLGVLAGDDAVKIFTAANLPPTTLGEIWNIADEDSNGRLTEKGVAIAVRLIGHAQTGGKITPALAQEAGHLANIKGISQSVLSQQSTGMSLPKAPPAELPVLAAEDKTKFHNMFMRYGPENGLLNSEKARDIFIKSKLSNDKLLQIWNLSDTQKRGSLDTVEFTIAMYFIQCLMTGRLHSVPATLPLSLYQQAGGALTGSGSISSYTPLGSAFTTGAHVAPQLTGLQPNHTGMSTGRPPSLPARPVVASAIGSSAFGSFVPAQVAWDVSPAEKSNADRYFDGLDIQRRGYIEGDIAVPFMIESKLPGEDLAQIWDLADIHKDGRLTRDGFAVAMKLIKQKLSGSNLPVVLPASLVPPFMRSQDGTTSESTQPEIPKDLFSFDDSPPTSAVSAPPKNDYPFLQPQKTGPDVSSFAPSSTAHVSSNDPLPTSQYNTPSKPDFLSNDDNVTSSPPLHNKSAEIGNLKIQLHSTSQSLDIIKRERVNMEHSLADQVSQLSDLQTQLSLAKSSYEAENKLFATFKERFANQAVDIQKIRGELIRAESDLSGVRVEKAEIEGSFLRDKEEARDLHRRMAEAGQQAEALKIDIEKAKKDAKQQKGLLAIAKKQLSTKEAEKTKLRQDLEDANLELVSINREKDAAEYELAQLEQLPRPLPNIKQTLSQEAVNFAATRPLPTTPDLSVTEAISPTLTKRNNPFERLAMASGASVSGQSTPRAQSPFAPFATKSASSSPHAAPASEKDLFDNTTFEDSFKDAISFTNISHATIANHDSTEIPTAMHKGPIELDIDKQLQEPQSEVAGVNAFDEAMGNIPASHPNPVSSSMVFSFDTAFEDNFDFASAANVNNGPNAGLDSQQSGEVKAVLSFDEVFPISSDVSSIKPSAYPASSVYTGIPRQSDQQNGNSTFDTTFSGFEPVPSLQLDNMFSSSVLPTTEPPAQTQTTPEPQITSLPISSSPRRSQSILSSSRDSHFSPTPMETTPGTLPSLKARQSMSSKDGRDASSKHSKLSLRLPFGKNRKRKTEESKPNTAVPQDTRSFSPAVEDDVDAVKQLASMGFRRNEAVSALEMTGYDVPKALNSLLGTP